MSKAKRKRAPTAPVNPSPQLILAAVERASRHRAAGPTGAPIWAILAHLAIPRRGSVARAVRATLAELHREGMLGTAREHGVDLWVLLPAARTRMGDAAAELPESPQHAAWRSAQTAATQEIARFRARLTQHLDEAGALLRAKPRNADAWLELGEKLQRDCWLLASATHCLYEWPEPDDAVADLDNGIATLDVAELARRRSRRAGLRNVGLWRER